MEEMLPLLLIPNKIIIGSTIYKFIYYEKFSKNNLFDGNAVNVWRYLFLGAVYLSGF